MQKNEQYYRGDKEYPKEGEEEESDEDKMDFDWEGKNRYEMRKTIYSMINFIDLPYDKEQERANTLKMQEDDREIRRRRKLMIDHRIQAGAQLR